MARFLILLTTTSFLASGCSTVETYRSWHDESLAEYTITVPDDAEIYATVRPAKSHDGGLVEVDYGQDWVIYPRAFVVRIPDNRGFLALYDPDTEGYTKSVIDDELCHAILTYGCPMEGFYNDLYATEAVGDAGGGRYYKTVHYDRCGNQYPAGLVGHYENASMATRDVFERILRSVRR